MAALNNFTPAAFGQVSPASFCQVAPIPGAGSATTLLITNLTNNAAIVKLVTAAASPTGTAASGSFQITVSSAAGISIGQLVYDITAPGRIANGTAVLGISGTTITLSSPVSAALAADNLAFVAQITNNQGVAVIPAYPVPLAIGSNTYMVYLTHSGTQGGGFMNTVLNLAAGA